MRVRFFSYLYAVLHSLARTLRRNSALLVLLAIVLAWPHAQGLLEHFLLLSNALVDATQASWLSLGNVLSKLAATALVAAFGFAFMWNAMKFTHPSLTTWARSDDRFTGFKNTFNNLDHACKIKYFTIYWFGSLFFFALLFVGASTLA